jgi:hypothetical protein
VKEIGIDIRKNENFRQIAPLTRQRIGELDTSDPPRCISEADPL